MARPSDPAGWVFPAIYAFTVLLFTGAVLAMGARVVSEARDARKAAVAAAVASGAAEARAARAAISIDQHRRYIGARDRAWAEELGITPPPTLGRVD